MNVSAAISIFATIAIAGAIVIPLVLMLVRTRAERDDLRSKDQPEPRSIVITIFVFIAALIFGFAGPAIFPNTWWGNLMGTLLGKVFWVAVVVVVAAFLLPVLQALGWLPKEQNRSTYVQGSRWRNHDPK